MVCSRGSAFAEGVKVKDVLSPDTRTAPARVTPQVFVLLNSRPTVPGSTVMTACAGARVKRPYLTYVESAVNSPRMGGRGKDLAFCSGFSFSLGNAWSAGAAFVPVACDARACWIVSMSIPSASSFMKKASPLSDVVTAPDRE